MFNVTVLKMRDIIKYLVGIIITVGVIVYTARYFYSIKKNLKDIRNESKTKVEKISFYNFTGCLDKVVPTMKDINKEYSDIEKENDKEIKINFLEEILKTEISTIKGMKELEKDENLELAKQSLDEQVKDVADNSNEEVLLANTKDIRTEVVTQNPIADSYNVQYENVKIKNQTTYTLTDEMLKPDIEINNKNILIFHTHSCESYTSSDKYSYMQIGNYRTTDLNFTVTRVGTELESYLKKYNLNVIHNMSYHDYPSYTGSYTRSLQTVENELKNTPSDIIIDLHRDAIGARADYAPTVKIGDDYAAQIMFVIGTNEGGLWHPDWNQNLKFAVKIQQKAEEMYPRFI